MYDTPKVFYNFFIEEHVYFMENARDTKKILKFFYKLLM